MISSSILIKIVIAFLIITPCFQNDSIGGGQPPEALNDVQISSPADGENDNSDSDSIQTITPSISEFDNLGNLNYIPIERAVRNDVSIDTIHMQMNIDDQMLRERNDEHQANFRQLRDYCLEISRLICHDILPAPQRLLTLSYLDLRLTTRLMGTICVDLRQTVTKMESKNRTQPIDDLIHNINPRIEIVYAGASTPQPGSSRQI